MYHASAMVVSALLIAVLTGLLQSLASELVRFGLDVLSEVVAGHQAEVLVLHHPVFDGVIDTVAMG